MRAFLGLGSNLGDRWAHLRAAVAALPDLVAVSPVYETDPVGGPAGQGAYLNCVVELDTSLEPRQLLELAHRLETAAGRERGERWRPRSPRFPPRWWRTCRGHSAWAPWPPIAGAPPSIRWWPCRTPPWAPGG